MTADSKSLPRTDPTSEIGHVHPAIRLLLPSLVILGADCSPSSKPTPTIDVYAAASIADAIEAIGYEYARGTGANVVVSRGASGILCEQISSGAPWDVFIPADPAFVDRLAKNAPNTTRRVQLCTNQLTLIVRQDFEQSIMTAPADETAIAERIKSLCRSAKRLSIANVEHAPAGRFAQKALTALDIWKDVESKLVYGDDVRMTARYVADGVVDAGIVYQTDALAFKAQIGEAVLIPADFCVPIVYEGCANSTADCEGRGAAFLDYLRSDTATAMWRAHGFAPLSRADPRSGDDPR